MFITDVIGAMDAKRSDMGGGNHVSGVLDICAGFPAKTKDPVQEVIFHSQPRKVLLCG